MSDVFVRNVKSHVEVEGVDMRVTDVEVNRSFGTSANLAKIKGLIDDVDTIELDQEVEVYVNGNKLFTGNIKHATENDEGIVTIKAYDILIEFQNKYVNLNLEEPRSVYTVLLDLITDAGFIGEVRESNPLVESFQEITGQEVIPQASVAPKEEFICVVPIKNGYGSGRRAVKLADAVKDLVKRLHGVVYVDTDNVLRIEPYPYSRLYEAKYVLQLDGGDSETSTSRVIVEGGSPVGEQGLASASVYSQVSPSSMMDIGGDEKKSRTITDQNVITQQAANGMASREAYEDGLRTDIGSVTITGWGDIKPFDEIIIPNLDGQYNLAGGRWTVKSITHTVNTKDGFKTKLTLSPTADDILSESSGAGAQLGQSYTALVDGRMEEYGVIDPIFE